MNKFSMKALGIIAIAWVIDFLTKWAAVSNLSNFETVNILGETLRFRLVYNTGGVFGIFQGNPMIFHILTGIAIAFLLVYFLKTPQQDKYFNNAIIFVLGGAIGNFTDRFFRPGVVDFIDMGIGSVRWPTYNVADMFISLGGLLLIISFYHSEKKIKKKKAVKAH